MTTDDRRPTTVFLGGGRLPLTSMGVEYRIKFKRGTPEQLDQALCRLAPFHEFDSEWKAYRYRWDKKEHGMPDAVARIEPDGLYFVDYGKGREVLGWIIAMLVDDYDQVTIELYEP